ncbi:MAG: nitrate/nitrite transporter NrtS [Kiloniellales bacterium]|nr:nitrate/nitrite transporter NrtS [Kiloniellales bacterium]
MAERQNSGALAQTLQWPNLRNAIMVALVVGSLLNLINQGDAILGMGEIQWPKLLLTYCVPFFVALYGAYSANRTRLS